jgi:hypothetical protein
MEILEGSYGRGGYDRNWFVEGNVPVHSTKVVIENGAHGRRIERGALKVVRRATVPCNATVSQTAEVSIWDPSLSLR